MSAHVRSLVGKGRWWCRSGLASRTYLRKELLPVAAEEPTEQAAVLLGIGRCLRGGRGRAGSRRRGNGLRIDDFLMAATQVGEAIVQTAVTRRHLDLTLQ